MMEQNRQNDPIKSPEIQEMILSNRIGQISAELAKRLNIAPERALELFYASQTCADLHDKSTCLGERRDAGQKLCRNIVDTKKADILQCVHRNRFSRTGKPADDQKIHTIFPLMP